MMTMYQLRDALLHSIQLISDSMGLCRVQHTDYRDCIAISSCQKRKAKE